MTSSSTKTMILVDCPGASRNKWKTWRCPVGGGTRRWNDLKRKLSLDGNGGRHTFKGSRCSDLMACIISKAARPQMIMLTIYLIQWKGRLKQRVQKWSNNILIHQKQDAFKDAAKNPNFVSDQVNLPESKAGIGTAADKPKSGMVSSAIIKILRYGTGGLNSCAIVIILSAGKCNFSAGRKNGSKNI